MLIRYFAAASEAAGRQTEELDVTGMTVAQLITYLGSRDAGLREILAVSSLLADGVRVDNRSDSLTGITQLDVLPPFAGG